MGHIVKKIIGDVEQDPGYETLTVEDNSNAMVHVHLKNLRFDIDHDTYNALHDAIASSIEDIRAKV